jgi:hypothetical protein
MKFITIVGVIFVVKGFTVTKHSDYGIGRGYGVSKGEDIVFRPCYCGNIQNAAVLSVKSYIVQFILHILQISIQSFS